MKKSKKTFQNSAATNIRTKAHSLPRVVQIGVQIAIPKFRDNSRKYLNFFFIMAIKSPSFASAQSFFLLARENLPPGCVYCQACPNSHVGYYTPARAHPASLAQHLLFAGFRLRSRGGRWRWAAKRLWGDAFFSVIFLSNQ